HDQAHGPQDRTIQGLLSQALRGGSNGRKLAGRNMHVRQSVSYPVNMASLPTRLEHPPRYVALNQTYGGSRPRGRLRNTLSCSASSLQSFKAVLFEVPLRPIACPNLLPPRIPALQSSKDGTP